MSLIRKKYIVVLWLAAVGGVVLSAPTEVEIRSPKDVEKRATPGIQFEGCFTDTSGNTLQNALVFENSDNINHKCVDQCAEAGYAISSTKGSNCYCTNVLPLPREYDAGDPESSGTNGPCSTTCPGAAIAGSSIACQGTECCGGPNAYSVYLSGEIDALKQLLRRVTAAHFRREGIDKLSACPCGGTSSSGSCKCNCGNIGEKIDCNLIKINDKVGTYTVYAVAKSVNSQGVSGIKNCTLSTTYYLRLETYVCEDIASFPDNYLDLVVQSIDRLLETEEPIQEEAATDFDIINDNIHGSEPKTVGKEYSVSTSFDESWSTEHGLDISTTIGAEFEVGAIFSKATTSFELSIGYSFTSGYEKSVGESVTETFSVSTTAAPGTTVETRFYKSYMPVEVKWRADIFAHGVVHVKESTLAKDPTTQKNIIELLSYDERKLFAFGTLDYGERKTMIARSYTTDANGNLVNQSEDEHDVED